MSSNLIILYPETQTYCTRATLGADFSTTPNEHQDHPVLNSFNGPRWQLTRSRNDDTNHSIIYDTGPNGSHLQSFIYLSKLNIMRSYGITIQADVGGSNDASTWTNYSTYADISALTLTGPNNQDYVEVFGADVGPYRYYRFKFSSGSSFELAIGKIFCGMEWDPGTNPDDYRQSISFDYSPTFEVASGALLLGRSDLPRLELTIDWINVSDDLVNTFFRNIYQYRQTRTFALYATAYNDLLNGNTIVPVMLLSASTDNSYKRTNTNRLRTRWMEVLG